RGVVDARGDNTLIAEGFDRVEQPETSANDHGVAAAEVFRLAVGDGAHALRDGGVLDRYALNAREALIAALAAPIDQIIIVLALHQAKAAVPVSRVGVEAETATARGGATIRCGGAIAVLSGIHWPGARHVRLSHRAGFGHGEEQHVLVVHGNPRAHLN